jgi:phosphoserine phosphatase
MRLYFIRHGECVWNGEWFLQGRYDAWLSEKWVVQSELLAERLSQIDFDVMYCSPLSRAMSTADIINQHHQNVEIIIDDRLTGRDYGPYERASYESILWNHSNSLSLLYKLIDGMEWVETWASVQERSADCMNSIVEKYADKRVVIVTHNEIKASCIQHLFHPDMPNDYFNASLTILEYENGERDFGTLNDISHLNREKSHE